jgi:squalene-hopene/tetraprenyl-beta-curcumene cyclase
MTMTASASALDTALERGTRRLLELQHADGYWVGELESNATMIAEHLFMLHFLGLRDAETDRKLANELLARRRGDGTWAIWWGGPPDLSVTVEAYVALKLAGVDAGEPTRAFVRREGGIARTRIFTRAFLALLGQWPWHRMVNVPVELILAPPGAPLSVYDFACWARQTLVPLSVVMALKPVRPVGVDLSEIGARPGGNRRPLIHSVRRRAIRVAERWVRERQEADGSWGGIQPPWVWSLLMLAALGHNREDECFRRGIDGWAGFLIDEGDRLRPEACQSPVWDTALAVLALRAAGVPADHLQLVKAGAWLLAEEVTVRGDWAVRRPGLAPGGWAFEFQNDLYPDIDDTAVVALALRELGIGEDAVGRGLAWTAGMQSANGGWGAFDADNTKHWIPRIPFCDFGAVIDPPSEDVTAHALETLAGEPGYEEVVRRGLDYLLREQQPDGSWWGRWGVNHLYGTGAAMPALEACGVPPFHPAVGRALAWLDSVQHDDGSFGEDILSYADPALRGRGPAAPSQTAWALLGYVAGGAAGSAPAEAAADYLCQAQRPDGDWDELSFTGTGFPLDFMIRYHYYRITFPMLALGRYREKGAR